MDGADARDGHRRLGVAMGGGAELGLAHIGVLSVLEEHGIIPSYLSGSSAGALVATFCAAGASVQRMREMALRLSWRELQRLTLPVLAISSNEPLGRFLRRMLPVQDFASLKIPLRIVTTDLLTAEMVVYQGGPPFDSRGLVTDPDTVFATGDLIDAVRASCARPVINHPVTIGDRLLVDGDLTNNVPATLVRDMGADVVIGIDLHARRWKSTRPRNILSYATQAQAIYLHWCVKNRRVAADVVIRPDFSALASLDFSSTPELIACGERAARKALPEVLSVLHRPALSVRPV